MRRVIAAKSQLIAVTFNTVFLDFICNAEVYCLTNCDV